MKEILGIKYLNVAEKDSCKFWCNSKMCFDILAQDFLNYTIWYKFLKTTHCRSQS
jgi:hypothetical protein